MLSIETIIKTVSKVFESEPIKKAWLFGSYARGEQTSNSDIDILVDFDKENYPSLLDHAGMMVELEEKLNTKIDIVPYERIFPSIKINIDKEKVLIYERS